MATFEVGGNEFQVRERGGIVGPSLNFFFSCCRNLRFPLFFFFPLFVYGV